MGDAWARIACPISVRWSALDRSHCLLQRSARQLHRQGNHVGNRVVPPDGDSTVIVAWTWQDQWLYVAGPALGAVAGVLIYNWVRNGEKPL